MRYRPWSSVTTVLLILVGRSVVSAITHTPASGPFGPRTTPPISVAPTLTVAGCCATTVVGATPNARAMATAATPKYKLFCVFMLSPPLSDSEVPFAIASIVVHDRRRALFYYAA